MDPSSVTPENIPRKISAAIGAKAATNDTAARLEERRLFGDATRTERYKTCLHILQIVGLIALGGIVIIVLVARIAYLVLPEKWQWMNTDQVRACDQFMFTGIMGGVITHIGKQVGFMSKKEQG